VVEIGQDDRAAAARVMVVGPMMQFGGSPGLERHEFTDPSQHGWAIDYRIRREDGEELHAEVRCWEKAEAAARGAANVDALAAIADRGVTAALDYAEVVESPASRGAVLISIWFDPADAGRLHCRASYERGAE
jgi:hypothetical protein